MIITWQTLTIVTLYSLLRDCCLKGTIMISIFQQGGRLTNFRQIMDPTQVEN